MFVPQEQYERARSLYGELAKKMDAAAKRGDHKTKAALARQMLPYEDVLNRYEQGPKAVKSDSRICFGIVFFGTEEEAERADEMVRKAGHTYNGGWFDGMPCGRETRFDYDDPELGRLYAVTTR